MAIIKSLLDQDLYKFSMMSAVLHQFPGTQVEYEYKCRNSEKIKWNGNMITRLMKEIDNLCELRFTEEELDYLGSLRFMKQDFIDFLRIFKLDKRYLEVSWQGGELKINIKGPWLQTIFFEVFLLAIVNEVYFMFNGTDIFDSGRKRLLDKIETIKGTDIKFKLTDFGTRRRYSGVWQDEVVKTLTNMLPNHFIGTSNVMLAKKYNIKPIGTMGHEILQCGQALTKVRDSQKFIFQKWAEEYRGDLGIALSDVVGVDAFIRDFDMYFCKLFDGCRHDSGNPFIWVDKIIDMYKSYDIDPKTKIAVFSDGLNVDKAIDIFRYVDGRIKTTFGIGTNLTNDIVGVEPLNIVIKVIKCNGQPVAKISNSPGKCMCEDEEYLKYLKSQMGVK